MRILKGFLKGVAWLVAFFVTCFVIFYFWAQRPPSGYDLSDIGLIEKSDTQILEQWHGQLNILTWNIAYLYGLGSEADTYQPRDKALYDSSLTEITEFLKSTKADLVFLQEVDFAASRSFFMDQGQLLQKHAGYPYSARAVSWSANFIPFPFMPLARQLRQTVSGGLVLSRLPIIKQKILYHAQPEVNPFWYNAFYLHRYSQGVQLQLDEHTQGWFVNNHLEADDSKTQELQFAKLAQSIADGFWPPKDSVLAVLGDMNGPIDSAKFESIGFGEFLDVQQNFEMPFTYPTDRPRARIDYIFAKNNLKPNVCKVLVEAGTLSDHFPIQAIVELKK